MAYKPTFKDELHITARIINGKVDLELEVIRDGEVHGIGSAILKSGDMLAIPWGENADAPVEKTSRSRGSTAILDADT